MTSLVVFMGWLTGAALAPNIEAQLILRFLAGLAASTPLVCSGGSIADMFNSIEKTWAFPLYAIPGFAGPVLGPVIGSYFGPSPFISWRWSEWICVIMAALVLVIVFFTMPETYAPLILQWKAAHLRKITGDDRFRAEFEVVDSTLFSRLKVAMTRPFMMVTEPIVAVMTLYLTVIYIVLFTFLDGYTYIFEKTYGISQGLSNVCFTGLAFGIFCGFAQVPIMYKMTLNEIARLHASDAKHPFRPEIRLWFAMLGAAPAIPISLFWMGWTARPPISIWSPILASVLFGYGVIGLFLTTYMYIIDSYETFSASALTFVALVRYVAAGGMTVAGIPFYENMGVAYTLTIMACISATCVPIPFVLYKYGPGIRKRSRFAVSLEM
jgi:MFS family permease